jgi:hypothetical protein
MERKNALMECVRPLKEDCRCVAKYIHSIGGPDACDVFARMLIQARSVLRSEPECTERAITILEDAFRIWGPKSQ